MTKKAWGGRFTKQESPLMEKFNASLFFDRKLYQYDIKGSMAHAKMLKKIGVLNAKEHSAIQKGLNKILKEFETDTFVFKASDEDIHMAIEARLFTLIGDAAHKLHTGRSRNDQVATDVKLYVKDHTQQILKKLKTLKKSFLKLAQKNTDKILPGYTHLQRAKPILLAHQVLVYANQVQRDLSRFEQNLTRLQDCPLGSGALSGSTIALDRKMTAKDLGFKSCSLNSMDSVSDRDFVLDFLYATSVFAIHASRFCEDHIAFASQEFSFVKLPEDFCTGSSMMPQKINPDALELIRGKSARFIANLNALLILMKSLPLTYNKDMQEDKEPLFDSCENLHLILDVLNQMVPKLKYDKKKMQKATQEGFLLATDLADYLTQKKIPFRKAHEIVGKIVRHCAEQNLVLESLDLKTYQEFCAKIQNDVYKVLNIQNSIDKHNVAGGTALKQVLKQIEELKNAKI